MAYIKILLECMRGRWFLIPSSISTLFLFYNNLRSYYGMTDLPELSGWAIAFFVMLPISLWFVVFLLIKAVQLQKEIDPSISLSDPILYEYISGDKNNKIYRVRFEVKNVGAASILEKCIVKFTIKSNEITPLPPGIMETNSMIVVPTEKQARQHKYGKFDLNPTELEHITLLRFVSGNVNNPISLISEDGTKQLSRKLSYKIKIDAYCEKGSPSSKCFDAFVNKDDKLCLKINHV